MPRSARTKSGRKIEKVPSDGTRKETDRENPFINKVINEAQTKSLLEADVEEVEKQLAIILNLKNYSTVLLEASQLDYFVGVFWWTKEQGFTLAQTSALFTAAHVLLHNIKDKHMHILDNIKAFRDMLSGVGQVEAEAPGGLDCFEVLHAKTIAQFFHTSLFQHYRLYQFVFSHTQAEEIIGLDLSCELVPPANIPYPAPLAEGLPHDVWEKYIKTPPPTPPPATELDLEAASAEQEAKKQARLQEEAELAEENAILSKMTPEEIQQVVELVAKDTFKNLNAEVAAKLRERENTILTRINKIHKVATT
ncbi:ciliary-associated calcium-binding coiled-coil protein 1-like isoform X2 [Watersipora subatra]|uniref:ciliary-associated calcium-binding coiled-coil protein 1-like isoform X2 n=1 Tax=Watersipora subatra TaxID=2589382 RepID=UPI00355B4A68